MIHLLNGKTTLCGLSSEYFNTTENNMEITCKICNEKYDRNIECGI